MSEHSAENDARPDVPHVGLFNRHADAVSEASRRAWATGYRYRVRLEPANHWWQITEQTRVLPPERGES